MSSESLGKRLKRLREQAGLSQAALAVAAGVPVGTVRGAEYDRREPLVTTAGKLARALGVSLDELVGGDEPQSDPADAPKKGPGRPAKVKAEGAEPTEVPESSAKSSAKGSGKKPRRKKGEG